MPTPKPVPKSSRGDDSLPLYDGSYYLIVTRTVQALREEAGVRDKLRGFTRGARALGTHTKRRLSALSIVARVGAGLALVAVGAAAAVAFYLYAVRLDPEALRGRVRTHLAAGDFIAARRDLDELKSVTGELSRQDRRELAAPVQARIDGMAAALRAKAYAERKARRWDEALAALERLEELEVDTRWVLFARGEVLRLAGRDDEAKAVYERYVQLYPDSPQADDAVFWQALTLKGREPATSRALLLSLLERYPRSDFVVSARRMLAELDGESP